MTYQLLLYQNDYQNNDIIMEMRGFHWETIQMIVKKDGGNDSQNIGIMIKNNGNMIEK